MNWGKQFGTPWIHDFVNVSLVPSFKAQNSSRLMYSFIFFLFLLDLTRGTLSASSLSFSQPCTVLTLRIKFSPTCVTTTCLCALVTLHFPPATQTLGECTSFCPLCFFKFPFFSPPQTGHPDCPPQIWIPPNLACCFPLVYFVFLHNMYHHT